MTHDYFLEIEFTDYVDESLLKSLDGRKYQLNIFHLFQEQLEEVIGGMLCFQHTHLPEILPPVFLESTWILRICCCCPEQRMYVSNRIDMLLK
jgi:hypothetical protein